MFIVACTSLFCLVLNFIFSNAISNLLLVKGGSMIGNCQDSYSDWLEDLLLDVMGFARDLDYKMKSFLVTYLGLR